MTTTTTRRCLRSLAIAVLGTCLAGCLEREETIRIQPGGALSIAHRWTGDRADLDGGAARLPDPAVYQIERGTETNENGDEQHFLTARAEFRSAAEMPTRFGKAVDDLAASALTFATNLEIRREGNQTTYVFERRYEPRDWAHYGHFWRKAFPKDVEDVIYDENLWRRPLEDRRKVVHAITAHWRMLIQHWAEVGMAAVATDHPRLLEAQLAVRAAITERVAAAIGSDAAMRVVASPVTEIDAWSQRLDRDLEQLITERVRELLDLDESRIEAMRATMALLRDGYDVSRDLEDETFVVRLQLPGRITGHNGDEVVDGLVVWRFDGQSIRDRTHTLLAISVAEGR